MFPLSTALVLPAWLSALFYCMSLAGLREEALAAPGEVDTSFGSALNPDGWVYAIAVEPGGKLVIGGSFTKLQEQARVRIARLTSDGALDSTFDPGEGAPGSVRTIVLQSDGRVLVGGDFGSYSGRPHAGVVRLNPDGSVDESFNPGTGISGGIQIVLALAIQGDGRIVVGGSYTLFNGEPRINLVRLNMDGSLDRSFNPNVPSQSTVCSMVIQKDGKITVAGMNVSPVRYLPDGSLDMSFNVDRSVAGLTNAILEDNNGRLYVCGGMCCGRPPEQSVVRLLPNGSVDPAFVPRFRKRPEIAELVLDAMVLDSDGRLIVGGSANWTWAPNGTYVPLMRLEPDGTEDVTFTPKPVLSSRHCSALALQPTGKILVGGAFDSPMRNLARLEGGNDVSGPPSIIQQPSDQTVTEGQPAALSVWASSFVPASFQWQRDLQDIPSATNSVLNFTPARASDAARYRVIATNPSGSITSVVASLTVVPAPSRPGSVDDSFSPTPGPNDFVQGVIVQPDGRLLISGGFSAVDGVPRNQLARLNADGTLDLTFNPKDGPNPPISRWPRGLFLQGDGRVVVSYNGKPKVGFIRLHPDGTFDESFKPPDATLFALLRDGRMVVVQGGQNLLRLNPDGSLDPSFQVRLPPFSPGYGLRAVLEQSDARLLLIGDFGGVVMRVNPDGTYDDSYHGQGSQSATAVALEPDDKLLLAGYGARLVRLNRDGTLDRSFSSALIGFEDGSGTISALTVDGSGKILVGGAFRSDRTSSVLAVARLTGDGSLDSSFGEVTVNTQGGTSILTPSVGSLAIAGPDKILVGGAFTHINGFTRNRIARLNAAELPGPPWINIQPGDQSVLVGQPVSLRVWVSSASPVACQWSFKE